MSVNFHIKESPLIGTRYFVNGVSVCQNDYEQAKRATKLKESFANVESLAEFLHQNYRATAKSFKVAGPKAHDHGWSDCYGKMQRYFLRRARWLMAEVAHPNGHLLDGAK